MAHGLLVEVFFAGVHIIICDMPGKYFFSLIIRDIGERDLATTDTRAFFGLCPSVGCILLGLPTGRLFLTKVVATCLKSQLRSSIAMYQNYVYSQHFAILGRKYDIRDICDVATSLISSLYCELSFIVFSANSYYE